MDIENIRTWYYINSKPTRNDIREGKVKLPEGVNQSLIENLIPIFNRETIDCSLTTEYDNSKTNKNIVITSDWHIPFVDKDCLELFIRFLKEYQPDELVLNGNINDCTSFSTHPKIREFAQVLRTARQERDLWLPIAELIRTTLPNTKIIYIGSQCHEGWIDKWVSLSPILVDDDNYTIEKWFKLDDYGIDFIPEVYDVDSSSTFLISHGTTARGKGGVSAYAEMEMSGTNVAVGHTHRLSQVYKTNAVRTTVGFETGCLCERTPWYYIKGRRRMMDWQQGFVLLNMEGNSFGGSCVPIIRNSQDKPYCWIGKERIY